LTAPGFAPGFAPARLSPARLATEFAFRVFMVTRMGVVVMTAFTRNVLTLGAFSFMFLSNLSGGLRGLGWFFNRRSSLLPCFTCRAQCFFKRKSFIFIPCFFNVFNPSCHYIFKIDKNKFKMND
jgi:hypothetical protein